MKSIKYVSLLTLIILLMACKAQQTKTQGLTSGKYTIISIENREVSNFNLTLNVNAEENRISGYSGCNNYYFEYEESAKALNLGFGVSSKMYCQDTQFIEDEFFKASGKVKAFKQTKTRLELVSKSGEALIIAQKAN